MSRIDNTRLAYEKAIKQALENGDKITVVGMKASNHSDFTRRWEDAGLIVFQTSTLQSHIGGLVVRLKWNRHTSQKGSPNLVLTLGVLRRILDNLVDFLDTREEENATRAHGERPGDTSIKALGLGQANGEAGSSGRCESDEENKTTVSGLEPAGSQEATKVENPDEKKQAFALAVMKHLGGNTQGIITGIIAQRFTKLHLRNIRPRAIPYLLTPIIEEGHKVSKYIPSGHLLDLASIPQVSMGPGAPPADPTEKVRWLVANETILIDRVAELEAELAKAQAELVKVAVAKGLLEQMAKL